MSPITHIVIFKFADSVAADSCQKVAQDFLNLQHLCKRKDGSQYVLSVKGGLNNSPEGKSKGFQYGFVIEFSSEEDREWYLTGDPDHLAFARAVGLYVSDAMIFDFADKQF